MFKTDTSKLSPDQKLAWDEIISGKNLFITARAGAGKSYLINFIRRNFPGRLLVTASTGIAANNVGGRTIHSQFLINPQKPDPEESVAKLSMSRRRYAILPAQLLIIDEVSMVSNSLLDCLNKICKGVKKSDRPFGGMQIVVFGDFLQLPPVFKGAQAGDTICWDCASWQEAEIKPLLLTSNFRQAADAEFYSLLTRLRYNQLTAADIQKIQSLATIPDDSAIRIFSTNEEVDRYNYGRFMLLDESTERKYIAKCSGDRSLIDNYWKDSIIPEEIELRIGARVMLCRNIDLGDLLLFNGSLGWVVGYEEGSNYPVIDFDCGVKLIIDPMVIYQPMERDYSGEEYPLATISHIPLKLAYAVTVHKSQGQTFDKVFMDCQRTFVCGQVYVALSRARSLSGLVVHNFNPNSRGSISDQWIVNRYLQLEYDANIRASCGDNYG